jgi:hypothetical protein
VRSVYDYLARRIAATYPGEGVIARAPVGHAAAVASAARARAVKAAKAK